MQDTMLRIWRGLPSFRGGSDLKTWCHRIAVNVCLDHLRRRKETVSFDAMHEETGFDPADADSPGTEEQVLQRSECDRTAAALAQLPDEMR